MTEQDLIFNSSNNLNNQNNLNMQNSSNINTTKTPVVLSIQSHVVFGHAGNAAAVFPMQRIGIEVLPLNTVQFSNHTQYPSFTGKVLESGQITSLAEGIDNIGKLAKINGVVSGYLGSKAQGREILAVVNKIKQLNPQAIYLCDPVMGHPEKGCIVAPEVSDFLLQEAAVAADLICPNQLELNSFAGFKAQSLNDCINMAQNLLTQKTRAVMVKHLDYPSKEANIFETLLVTNEGKWLIRRPLLEFSKQPVGVGDLTSGLFLGRILLGDDLVSAFEFTASAVHEVLVETKKQNSYELQLINAQYNLANPPHIFIATKL